MSLEPIRQVWGDDKRATAVVTALNELEPSWLFYPTPPFFFTDYHMTKVRPNGRENYIGDLEVKWLKVNSSVTIKFPYQKLQRMIICPPYNENYNIYHRICFRFDDGLLLVPVLEMAHLIPQFDIRYDTNERDLNVHITCKEFSKHWIDKVVVE